jgi:hypothetical protein
VLPRKQKFVEISEDSLVENVEIKVGSQPEKINNKTIPIQT